MSVEISVTAEVEFPVTGTEKFMNLICQTFADGIFVSDLTVSAEGYDHNNPPSLCQNSNSELFLLYFRIGIMSMRFGYIISVTEL